MATTSSSIGHRFDLVGLVGTGVLSYKRAVTSVNGLPGAKNSPAKIGSYSYYATYAHPETGNKITGFKWDGRALADDENENWDASIPINWDATTSGVPVNYFQSGIGDNDDLEYLGAQEVISSGVNDQIVFDGWTPEINHGYYYDFQEEGYLYSDDSEIVYPSFSGVIPGVQWSGVVPDDAVASGFNTISLLSFPKVGVPITAVQTEWDTAVGKYNPVERWRKRVDFTGIRDADLARQSTRDEYTNGIWWQLVDRADKEFIVSYSGVTNDTGLPSVIFNQQCVEPVGTTTSGVLFSGLELVGISTGGANQEFHCKYSPIDRTMLTQVLSFNTVPSGYIPESVLASGVDGDGMIGGGVLYSGLIEWGDLNVVVKEWVPQPLGTAFSGYRANMDYDFGIVSFGDPDDPGVEVPSAGEYIGVGYWKTVRVEYEPEDAIDTILALEANLNPVYRHSGQGFVYLSTRLEDPVNIVLTSELPEIAINEYGPLNIGNNYAPVIATVKDGQGNTLEDQPVTFTLLGSIVVGSFGTSSNSTTAVTNEEGAARAFYNPPRTIIDIGEEIEYDGYSVDAAPSYPGVTETTILRTSNMLIEGNEDDILLFQNLVDDPILGWMETSLDQDDLGIQLEQYYRMYFLEHDIYSATGLDGAGDPNPYLDTQTWEDMHRMLLDLSRPSLFLQDRGMGRKVLVAAPDVNALDPHTLTANAWAPVHPIEIIEISAGVYDLVYDTSTYDIPVPSGTMTPTASGNLFSYFVVAPTMVEVQASVYNERLQQTIFSNIISVQLAIPEYMSGVWTLDEINQVQIDEVNTLLSGVAVDPTKKIPLGFRFRTSNVTLAGALNGVTFLDVNPTYNANVWDTDEVTPLGHRFSITSIV